jgi:protein-S-isoprenylcysteine O-methyltransferase Ste14
MINHFIKSFLGMSIFFVPMFLAAGKIGYREAWVYFAVSIFGLLINIALSRGNAGLVAERSKPGANVQPWDKKILGLLALVTIIAYAVAGLDSGRFHWSSPSSLWLSIAGVCLVVAGQIIFAVAKHQNAFFSSVARLQAERDHKVYDGGLYGFVRHPGYLGMILSWIGFPLIMGSAYSSIPVLAAVILLIIRTRLEDKFLIKDLTGYQEYTQRTKYRLLPLIW